MSNEVDELAELVRAMVREELAELGVGAGVVAEMAKPVPPPTVRIKDGEMPSLVKVSVEDRLSRLENAIKPRQQLVAR